MPASPPFLSILKPNPAPLWYVTNGDRIVGPVRTGLLTRGVAYGRVPEYCSVSPDQGPWRKLTAVREIAALYRRSGIDPGGRVDEPLADMQRASERIRDQDDFCYHVTRLARLVTGAESAMFHVRGRFSRTFTTRCVLGPMPDDRLNHALSETDPVLRSAWAGRPVLGPPYGLAEDALAMCFATTAGGVGGAAMVPIFMDGTLAAMLELARPGHAFRMADLQRAERIAQGALFQYAN